MKGQPPAGSVRVLVVDDDAAFATAVLALLMGTDRNGDPFARVIMGVAAFVVFLYAILRLLGVDVTLRIPERK